MKRFRSTALAAALSAIVATLVPAAPASALPAWQDHNTSWTSSATAPKVLNLRYATHPRFDRVVIDIQGLIPAGNARYQRRFHEDGSGNLVPIGGRSGIAVALMPAYAHDDNGNNTYAVMPTASRRSLLSTRKRTSKVLISRFVRLTSRCVAKPASAAR